VITLMLLHQPNRSLSNFRRKSPLSGGWHRHSLSNVEASDKTGAVQHDGLRGHSHDAPVEVLTFDGISFLRFPNGAPRG